MTTEKPVAELRILPRPSGALTYLLYSADATLLWEARGYSTEHGKTSVREKLRIWNAGRYKIVMKEEPAASDQEAQFWSQFKPLNVRAWSDVELLLKRRVKKPATVAEWNGLFKAVGEALAAEDQRRATAVA